MPAHQGLILSKKLPTAFLVSYLAPVDLKVAVARGRCVPIGSMLHLGDFLAFVECREIDKREGKASKGGLRQQLARAAALLLAPKPGVDAECLGHDRAMSRFVSGLKSVPFLFSSGSAVESGSFSRPTG